MRANRLGVVLVGVAMGATGCTGESTKASALLAAPPDGAGLQLGMQAHIEPGEEATYCRSFVVPEGETLPVSKFEHRYSPGSHHLLLFRTTLTPADVAAETEPWECATANVAYPVVYAAQIDEAQYDFPENVALTFQPGEVLMVQTHYLNATAEALDAEVAINLWRSATPPSIEAGTLFFYDWAIVVPPGDSTARMRCAIPEDIHILFAQSHMHRRGVGYDSWVVDPAAPEAAPTSVYATTAWEDIAPGVFTPAVDVHAGQAIDFECRYRNDEGRTIVEGPSASDNEMCMFVGVYYPRIDFATESCLAPGSGPKFQGTHSCSDAIGCQMSAGDEIAAEECVLDTCAGSGDELVDMGRCTILSCGEVCGMQGNESEECMSCVTESCGEQLTACLRSDC